MGACVPRPIHALVAQPPDSLLVETFATATGAYASVAGLECPDIRDNVGAIAVDRAGIIYVAGYCPVAAIYRIDPATAACVHTPYRGPACITQMAFASDPTSATGETLYYTSAHTFGAIDPATSQGRTLAELQGGANVSATFSIGLAGGADGALYAAVVAGGLGSGTEIDAVEPATGALTARWLIAAYPTASEASVVRKIAAVGSDFYLFDGSEIPGSGEAVRFSTADQSATVIGDALEVIAVGANTCATD